MSPSRTAHARDCRVRSATAREGGGAPDAAQLLELYRAGRHQDVLHHASAALRANAQDAELWHISAGAAYALGLTEDAERFWTAAIAHDANHADAHYNLGILFLERERTEEAARHLSRAVLLAPHDARAMNSLGALLTQQGRLEAARVLLQRAIELDPRIAQAHQNLGLLSIQQNRLEEARASLDQAVHLAPDSADAHAARAKLRVLEGDDAGAERDMLAALAADPGHGTAHLFRVEQRKTRIDTTWSSQLRTAYENRRCRSVTQRMYLDFAMGKLAERLGEYELAFQAFAEGNALHHQRFPFDEAAADQFAAAAMRGLRHDIYADSSCEPGRAEVSNRGRVPVFIIGMPRSGTTLLEQILASHPEIFGAGELTTLTDVMGRAPLPPACASERSSWLQELRALGDAYLARVWKPEVSARFVIDKMPGNFRLAGWIPLMMPQAKIIHIRRDPMDTCFSCFSTFFAEGHEYTYDQTLLARQYGRYRLWMEHWRNVLPMHSMIEIDYEALVSDLEGVTRAALAHIGLEWHERCAQFHQNSRAVHTASRDQVSKPLYASSIGRWRPFERYLAPMQAALAPYLSGNVT